MSTASVRRIEDATPRPARRRTLGAIAAFACAAAVAWRFDAANSVLAPWTFVAGALAVVGLVQGVRAIRASFAARRFGPSVLDVEGGHVDAEGELPGRIYTSRDLAPAAGFRLRLACVESVRVADAVGASRSRDEDRVTFEDEHVVPAVGSSAREGIPVSFRIPPQQVRTSTARRGARWTLDVAADVDGARYEARFAVPVASRGA